MDAVVMVLDQERSCDEIFEVGSPWRTCAPGAWSVLLGSERPYPSSVLEGPRSRVERQGRSHHREEDHCRFPLVVVKILWNLSVSENESGVDNRPALQARIAEGRFGY